MIHGKPELTSYKVEKVIERRESGLLIHKALFILIYLPYYNYFSLLCNPLLETYTLPGIRLAYGRKSNF